MAYEFFEDGNNVSENFGKSIKYLKSHLGMLGGFLFQNKQLLLILLHVNVTLIEHL